MKSELSDALQRLERAATDMIEAACNVAATEEAADNAEEAVRILLAAEAVLLARTASLSAPKPYKTITVVDNRTEADKLPQPYKTITVVHVTPEAAEQRARDEAEHEARRAEARAQSAADHARHIAIMTQRAQEEEEKRVRWQTESDARIEAARKERSAQWQATYGRRRD